MTQLDRIEKMLEYSVRSDFNYHYGTCCGDQEFYDAIDAPFDEKELLRVWKQEIFKK